MKSRLLWFLVVLVAAVALPAHAGPLFPLLNGDFAGNSGTCGRQVCNGVTITDWKMVPKKDVGGACNGSAHGYTFLYSKTQGTRNGLKLYGCGDGSTSCGFNSCPTVGCTKNNSSNTWNADGPCAHLPCSTDLKCEPYVSIDGAYQRGALEQTVNCLTSGDLYAVCFYWAAGQQFGCLYKTPTKDKVVVNLGPTACITKCCFKCYVPIVSGCCCIGHPGTYGQETAYVCVPKHGFSKFSGHCATDGGCATACSNWQKVSFVFRATTCSETLSFLAVGTPNGEPPFALLSGVSMDNLGVPELDLRDYATPFMALCGIGLILADRRKKA